MTLRPKACAHMRARHVRGAVRFATLYILAAALAAGFGLWVAERQFSPPPPPPPPPLHAVALFPVARGLPAFALQSGDGNPVTPASLKGHWTLVYLGFTHCPDVCPTTLQALGVAAKAWAGLPPATRPRVLFVSVDPKRDSPAHTAQYARYFGKDIIGATADEATLTTFAHALGMVFFIPKDSDGKNYEVDHSSSVAVLDPQGDMVGTILPQPPPAQAFDPGKIGADLLALARWR